MRYLLAALLALACAPQPIDTHPSQYTAGSGTCPELALNGCAYPREDSALAWPEPETHGHLLAGVHLDLAQAPERQHALRCLWYPPPCWVCPNGARVWHVAQVREAVDHWVTDGCDGPGEGRVQRQGW